MMWLKRVLTRQKLKTQLFNSIKNEISARAGGTYCLFACKRVAKIAVLVNPDSVDATNTNKTKQKMYFHLLNEITCTGKWIIFAGTALPELELLLVLLG